MTLDWFNLILILWIFISVINPHNTIVKFKEWDCVLHFKKYVSNGRTAILLVDAFDEAPVATATVNLENKPLAPGFVFIKDSEENEGMLAALVNAGVIKPPIRSIQSGFILVFECELVWEFK